MARPSGERQCSFVLSARLITLRSSPSAARCRLRRRYGGTRWRKLKGTARVTLADGTIREAELHWYEAHGVGKRELKIKRFVR